MRIIALILCFALTLGVFAGCESEEAYVPTGNALADATVATEETVPQETQPEEGPVFTLGYFSEDGFNPYTCTGFTNRQIFSLLYQGLFTVDDEYHVEPLLCKSYTVSEDMMTYTFRLETATFSDGSYVQAEDVVASLEAASDNDYYEGRFRYFDSIEAPSANTVTITTAYPVENLPILLDIPIVKKDQVDADMPVGSGPYKLARTASGLSLVRRANWWCQAELPVQAESITLWSASSNAKIRDWFEFDELGIAYADPGAGSYAEYRCDYEVWDCETGIMIYLACNAASNVFSNAAVRSALTYAIDRETLAESNGYHGFAQVATLPASPNSPYYDETLASQITYQPEKLTKALTDNGLTGSTVTLLVNKSDSVRLQTARLIAQMLTECGLVVEMMELSTSYFKNAVYAGNYDIYLGQTQLSANMDLSEFFAPNGYMSWGSMGNSDIYNMCLESLENIGNYYTLHQMVVRDGQLTPLLFRTYAVYMKRGLLDGLEPARDNVYWYSIGKTMEDALTTG